ncbi:Rve-domain-containing hypothetical protein [Phytophthora megakarya]|uniref:Integrase catalytic domain-containing protein n=1 Tax=Phytophthora megakarya TaxID=4795 RepID=A0A225WH68_9STRA|nr:Rve-domain-containing hypothetical protein [Phytophthora megakarya]
MARQQVAAGMCDELRDDATMPCWSCKSAKMTRMSYKKTKIMSDMCHVGKLTYDGYKHFQLVQDEASRYLRGFLMKCKEDASEIVWKHVKWLLAQGHKIGVFNSDQGHELLNNKLCTYFHDHGIEYTWTNAYSPEENGLVEKMNGVMMSRVWCILTASNMPWLLWGGAFLFAIEAGNVCASSALNGETPYYRRFDERPDITMLRTWGCLVFVFTPKVLRTSKLENPGKAGLFMGYAQHSESYRVLSMATGNIQKNFMKSGRLIATTLIVC